MNANEIADRLDGAAALIEERGHAKGVLADGRGGLCLFGAINMAHHGEPYHQDPPGTGGNQFAQAAGEYVAKAIGIELGHRCANVVAWNNAPEREGREVCAAARKAAQLARQQAPVGVAVHA